MVLQATEISIIVLTLNEGKNLQRVLRGFRNKLLGRDAKITVIDGNSTDDTVEIAQAEDVNVIIQRTTGKGAAIREGLEFLETNFFVFIDGDGTYDPNEVERLIVPLVDDEADMVIGSRFLGDMESGSMTLLNRFGNWFFTTLINYLKGAQITDALSGYRALRGECLRYISLASEGFEIEAELTMEFLSRGYRVMEIPIRYKRRREGKTKLRPIRDGLRILKALLSFL